MEFLFIISLVFNVYLVNKYLQEKKWKNRYSDMWQQTTSENATLYDILLNGEKSDLRKEVE